MEFLHKKPQCVFHVISVIIVFISFTDVMETNVEQGKRPQLQQMVYKKISHAFSKYLTFCNRVDMLLKTVTLFLM